jgi:hypothetical protein
MINKIIRDEEKKYCTRREREDEKKKMTKRC